MRNFLTATVAVVVWVVSVAAECSFCRYTAWNCSTTSAVNETTVLSASSGKADLRKVADLTTSDAVEVCDGNGRIQVDDVFCDGSDCACVDGKRCVSLVMGCQNIFQARSRKRCIGDSSIQHRFRNCATAQQLTTQASANLNQDWVYFKEPQLCKSADCQVVRRFHECGVVQCGYLVVAWKEDSNNYRFVIDGSRAADMEAGSFLFAANVSSSSFCKSIMSSSIRDCYSLQTRNQKDGRCDGVFLQADTKLKATGEKYQLSKLSWPVYIAVVGSVAAAIASVASVALVYLRHRRMRNQDELDGLLPGEENELKTPEMGPASLQDASSPSTTVMRQRVPSPRSSGMK